MSINIAGLHMHTCGQAATMASVPLSFHCQWVSHYSWSSGVSPSSESSYRPLSTGEVINMQLWVGSEQWPFMGEIINDLFMWTTGMPLKLYGRKWEWLNLLMADEWSMKWWEKQILNPSDHRDTILSRLQLSWHIIARATSCWVLNYWDYMLRNNQWSMANVPFSPHQNVNYRHRASL